MPLRDPERLKARILRSTARSPDTGCLIWTGCVSTSGYGVMYCEGRQELVHRVSHLVWVGPLEPGQVVGHSCDQALCVEPGHLSATTQRENLQDCCRRGRRGVSLSPDQVLEVYKLKDQAPARLIAPRYGVSPRQVLRIWSGEQWSFITGARPCR
jgi:hypothetical protein